MDEEIAYYGLTIAGGGGIVNWIVPAAEFKLMNRDNRQDRDGMYDVFTYSLKEALLVEIYVNWPLVAWVQFRKVQPQWAAAE